MEIPGVDGIVAEAEVIDGLLTKLKKIDPKASRENTEWIAGGKHTLSFGEGYGLYLDFGKSLITSYGPTDEERTKQYESQCHGYVEGVLIKPLPNEILKILEEYKPNWKVIPHPTAEPITV